MKMHDWFQLGHVAIFGYTAVLPRIGVGTAAGSVTVWHQIGLLGTAAAYHLFAYLCNELIDLALDITHSP
jgi:hypothetical protein